MASVFSTVNSLPPPLSLVSQDVSPEGEVVRHSRCSSLSSSQYMIVVGEEEMPKP